MNRGPEGKQNTRRGAARAERERETLRAARYAQRLEREGRAPAGPAERTPSIPPAPVYEAEIVPGLEEFARAELRGLVGARVAIKPERQAGAFQFPYRGDAR